MVRRRAVAGPDRAGDDGAEDLAHAPGAGVRDEGGRPLLGVLWAAGRATATVWAKDAGAAAGDWPARATGDAVGRCGVMLTGSYVFALDAKGRLVIPAPFREAVGDPVTLTAGPASSILLPGSAAPLGFPELIYQMPLDRTSGRVLIPYPLRVWAGLAPGDEVAVCGSGRGVYLLAWKRCLAALRERELRGDLGTVPELAALCGERDALAAALQDERRAGEGTARELIACRQVIAIYEAAYRERLG